MKAHILIVEDEAILYERLRRALIKEHYTISDYTPNVEKACAEINTKRPDLVLLDIDLQGAETGLDLGKRLDKDYKIPFIYVTQFNDNETFYKGLGTNHEDFVVKTKPSLDTDELLRKIQTVLNRNAKIRSQITKEALLCFTDYVENTKNHSSCQISQVPVPFEEIMLVTTNSTEKINAESTTNGKRIYQKLKPNYTRVENWKNQSFYLPVSLSEISGKLPHNFVRVNESEIVNIGHNMLDGRINGSRIKLGEHICHISKTYKGEVEKRFRILYQNFR